MGRMNTLNYRLVGSVSKFKSRVKIVNQATISTKRINGYLKRKRGTVEQRIEIHWEMIDNLRNHESRTHSTLYSLFRAKHIHIQKSINHIFPYFFVLFLNFPLQIHISSFQYDYSTI